MLKAKKQNRVVRIPDDKRKLYAALGYTITDMSGKVLHRPADTEKRVKELERENATLKKELEAAMATKAEDEAKKETDPVPDGEPAHEEPAAEKPSKTTRAKKAAT